MFVRARRAALALAALALLATGCGSGGGSKPAALPSISTSPSASASPTPSTPANDKAAVEAVVRRYFALLNGPTTAASAAALKSIMTPTCKCRRVATSFDEAVAKHQSYFGHSVINVTRPNVDGPIGADVVVDYDYTRGGLKAADGHVLEATPGRRGVVLDFRLRRQRDAWLIADVLIVADGKPA